MARLLRHRPLGLFTDLDGTISSIARTAGEAFVDARCHSSLAALASHLDLVAVVSGRRAADAREKVGIADVVYVGNHGLERWETAGVRFFAGADQYAPQVASALDSLRATLDIAGLVFEDKGLVAGVHYRLAPQPKKARREILDAVRQVAGGLKVAEGKRVVELRPPVECDKGTALAALISERRLRGAIYLGDDLTDVAAFRRLREMRRAGTISGLAVAVAGAETPAEVIRSADYVARGVDEVARVLEMVLNLA